MKIPFYLQCLTILLLPLYIVRFDIPLGNFHLPSTLLEVVWFLSFVASFWQFAKDGFLWSKLKTQFDPYILFFVISAGIATAASFNLVGGLGIFKAYILEPVLFFYSFVYINQQKRSLLPIYALISSVFLLSILAIFQKLTGTDFFAPNEITQGRVTAVYNSGNSLSLFITPLVFLCLTLFLNTKTKLKYLYLFLVFLISLTIIWTKSRGGLIAEIIGLLVFGYGLYAIKLKKLQKYWYFIPIILLILASLFFIGMYLTYHNVNSYLYTNVNSEDTLEVRYLIWSGTLNLIHAHPLFGAGLDGFKSLYASQFRLSNQLEELQYPHNIFLNFWAETGIFGLLAFILLIYKTFFVLLSKVYQQYPFLGLALISIFTYWVIHGLVDVPYFKNDLSMEFWLMIGMVQIYSLKKNLAK